MSIRNDATDWCCNVCGEWHRVTQISCPKDSVRIQNEEITNLQINTPIFYSNSRYASLLKYVQHTIDVLSRLKGGEYAGDEDRLANFRRNAERLGLSMEQIWAVYFMKHIDAILQHVKDLSEGKARVKSEPLQGRVDDAIVYLILMKAILDEKGGENELRLEG